MLCPCPQALPTTPPHTHRQGSGAHARLQSCVPRPFCSHSPTRQAPSPQNPTHSVLEEALACHHPEAHTTPTLKPIPTTTTAQGQGPPQPRGRRVVLRLPLPPLPPSSLYRSRPIPPSPDNRMPTLLPQGWRTKRGVFLLGVVVGCCVVYPSFHLLDQAAPPASSGTRGLLRMGSAGRSSPKLAAAASYEPQAVAATTTTTTTTTPSSSGEVVDKAQEKEEEDTKSDPLVGGALWQELEAELRAMPEYEALTSTQNVTPFRSPEDMARAQACFRQFQGYGYLLHMRKAGGTTLRNYLNDLLIAKPDHLVYVSEGQTFNVSCFRDQGELLTMTSLRHPMARILSSYWFEGQFQYKGTTLGFSPFTAQSFQMHPSTHPPTHPCTTTTTTTNHSPATRARHQSRRRRGALQRNRGRSPPPYLLHRLGQAHPDARLPPLVPHHGSDDLVLQ